MYCTATLVLYVPPHDLLYILRDLGEGLGPDRRLVVARELTKMHETFHR
jgi:16S rRNA (cytidine1402-2'-O)-methyltransferase